ncbi:7TM diverse intracellular signaling domain-containing protein [Pseudobacteriovorax antillogorgiicola]|uniref:Hpt domain-containing protein n=1 Tax=Pseudobacteriovorax antillogorgiicola TaxID=1513793 RepID=A0A1Y6BUJ3_9BACT|nr:7TM diverse intracellular signaling domain-containing protein [Pseudobacteriovorax antillogorgiicola]TCS53892.1 Hpt domain-containing protein [Pseudobacteriovorax antillogorgiicola]SMF20907.1 Hpt domain-containing protein [Pseudobacteriovorax antillogorgiicola]
MIQLLLIFLLSLSTLGYGRSFDPSVMERFEFLGKYSYLLNHEGPGLKAQDVWTRYQASPDRFTKHSHERPNYGFSPHEHWGIIPIENSSTAMSIVLENNFGVIDEFDLYLVHDGEIQTIYQGGDQRPFDRRYELVRSNNTKILVPHGTSHLVYRSQGVTINIVSLRAWHEQDFRANMRWEYLAIGTLSGIHIIMIFYNLFLAVSSKSSLYFKYVVFVVASLVFYLSTFNIGQEIGYHLFGIKTYSNHIMPFSVSTVCFFACSYSWQFLSMESSRYRLFKPIFLLILILCPLNMINAVFISEWYAAIGALIIPTIAISTFLTLAALRLHEGYRPAKLYIVAWVSYLFGSGDLVAAYLGLINYTEFNVWGQFIGGCIEIVVFSVALGARYNYFRAVAADEISKLNYRLQDLNKGLEIKVEERSRDVRDILTHIHQGIFTISERTRIDPSYSKHLEELFEQQDLGNHDIIAILQRSTKLSENDIDQTKAALLSMVQEDEIAFLLNEHLLPRHVLWQSAAHQEPLEYDLDWAHLSDGHAQSKVLVTVRDMTDKLKMEAEFARKSREIQLIAQLIDVNAERFASFQKLSNEMLAEVDAKLLGKSWNEDDLRFLFVSYHTLKGMSRGLGLHSLSDQIHKAESHLVAARQADYLIDREELTADQDGVKECLREYIELNNQKLGRIVDPSLMMISKELILRFLDSFTDVQINQKLSKDLGALKRHCFQTLEDICYNQLDAIKSMSDQLEKPIPKLLFDNVIYGLEPKIADVFERTITHLVRNSLAHGLETGQERITAGKKERGEIHIAQEAVGSEVVTYFQDDGQGVALDAIRSKAKALNYELTDENPESLLSLLLETGFSTRQQVDNIAGRGVGLDVVKMYIEHVGGQFTIQACSEENHGRILVRFMIALPDRYFSHIEFQSSQVA